VVEVTSWHDHRAIIEVVVLEVPVDLPGPPPVFLRVLERRVQDGQLACYLPGDVLREVLDLDVIGD